MGMIETTQSEINTKIELHRLFLKDSPSGILANFDNTDLSGFDLSHSNLSGAQFEGANLTGTKFLSCYLDSANFFGANLTSATISGCHCTNGVFSTANLTESILSNSSFRGTNFSNANLTGVTIDSTTGNMAEIKSMAFAGQPISYTNSMLQIGCIQVPLPITAVVDSDDWRNQMHPAGVEFWSVWGDIIKSILDLSPATPTGYE
jgi:uncharacterized protein YjbI with pentapeptide repeats